MLNHFKHTLLGTYHNQQQAYSDPTLWAHIYLTFEERGDDIYSKSWYAIESPKNPYRQNLLKLRQEDDQVIITSIDALTGVESHKIPFEYLEGYWVGYSNCVILDRNQYISTFIRFNGENYFSRDAGYDLKTHQFLWGKEDDEFHFLKVSSDT